MDYYSKIAPSYNELHEQEQLQKLRIIKQNLYLRPSSKILDVGCGTGLSFHVFPNVIGVDPSPGMLAQSGGTTMQAVAEKLPFKDQSFDVVLCITAVHNFNDIDKGLKEIKRVGKRSVITVLKKTGKYAEIVKLIQQQFSIQKKIDEDTDTIFFLK